VVMAIDGVPERGVGGVPEAAGIVAFNDFTNNVIKLRRSPWGTDAGEWLEEDELEMGAWLVREHGLPSMPRAALEEAVKMVAGRHRHHPVRDYLATLRGTWDQQKRCNTWLTQVCKAIAPPGLEAITSKYLSRVGTWMLMAMCARVMAPGCKYDYMIIFEGPQGVGKSTLARILGGEWFADTGLVLGDKDAYQNLQGVWVYEIGELDSFSKAEVTKVKQFTSSQRDRFRASFDRRPRDYPRQVIFVGTTNEDHYLSDATGNRRSWPVRVGGMIDTDWLRENRDQLLAEALHYFEAGWRFHPTPEEQRELFDPQQQERTVEAPIESKIVAYLCDEDQHVPHGHANGAYVNEITTADLLIRIGIGLEKQVSSPTVLKQANAVLKKLGWKLGKSSAKGGQARHNVYKRPAMGTQPAHVQGHQPERATDDCPL
jgi:putative DNA primase/helicase